MHLPSYLKKPTEFIERIEQKSQEVRSKILDRVPQLIHKAYDATSQYIQKKPCETSMLATFTISPVVGGGLYYSCYKSLQPQAPKTKPEQIKEDDSAAGRFLREQLRAQQSTVSELEKVICVGSTIVDGQELTVPVNLSKPGTSDPLGECVNSNGFRSKKLGYVSLADLEQARRIHLSEVAETKRSLIESYQREYELQISSQPAPTCEKK